MSDDDQETIAALRAEAEIARADTDRLRADNDRLRAVLEAIAEGGICEQGACDWCGCDDGNDLDECPRSIARAGLEPTP